MNTSDLINRVPASATISMAQKARDYKAKGLDVISLTLGEPDFDTPEFIKTAAKKALDDGFTKYTPISGLVSFREAIVNKFKRDNNLDFTADQIVVSTGAKQTLANIVLCTTNKDDEVLLPAPYWVSYEGIAIMAGAKVVKVKTEIDNDFKISPEELSANLTEKTRLMIFSSPCNPTGSLYSKAELEALAEVIKDYENIENAIITLYTGLETQPKNNLIYARLVAYLLMNGKIDEALLNLTILLTSDKDLVNEIIEFYPETINYPKVVDLIENFKKK